MVVVLLLGATGNIAHAANDTPSLFACGIAFGDRQLRFAPPSTARTRHDYRVENPRLRHVNGAIRFASPYIITRDVTPFAKKEKRLPRKFTFATVGCSWR